MNAICTYESLVKVMQRIDGIAQKNISLPILENILIEAKEGFLFFSATNLELGVISHITAKITSEGSIVIPPQLLQGFLHAISQEEHVSFIVEQQELHIKCGAYNTTIKGFNVEEFPIIPQVQKGKFFTVLLDTFQQMIHRVAQFASVNTIRPELTGVYVKKEEEKIICAATDSFRLGECEENRAKVIIENNDNFTSDHIILPQKLSQYINKISTDTNEIKCAIEDGHFFIYYNNTQITARLIDGTYPDYKQIIPQKTQTNIIVKKEDLIEAIRVMMVFVDQNAQEVHLKAQEHHLFITTKKQTHGEGDVKIPASIDGETQEIVLNPKYILDGIKHITQSDVFIGINNASSPILFYGADKSGVEKNFTYIIMPVKSA